MDSNKVSNETNDDKHHNTPIEVEAHDTLCVTNHVPAIKETTCDENERHIARLPKNSIQGYHQEEVYCKTCSGFGKHNIQHLHTLV
jgi:hypothetical protein